MRLRHCMEFVWLQDFIALAEEGSFSRAAKMRNVTQPAFSRRVRALEDWVGTPLFSRTAQGVILTAAGEVFAQGAPEILSQLLTMRARTREAGERRTQVLQFAATQTLSFTFFPGWIRKSVPFDLGLVQLNTANMSICEEIMAQGGAHFLLCHSHPEVEDPFAGRLPSIVLGHDRLVAVCGWRADGTSPGPGENGAQLPYLGYGAASGLGKIVAGCEPPAVKAMPRKTVFTSHLAAALRSLACDGEGLAWLPLSLIDEDMRAGRLRRMFDEASDIALEIRLFRAARLGEAAEQFWRGLGAS